jgi:beta-ureidopropionase / N-carbamoyl-L-amino-acid hydrolase
MSSSPTERAAPGAPFAVDSERLWRRLMAMALIGRRGESGVDRAAFSAEDRAARRLLYEWGAALGLDATQDAVGNLFLRYPGESAELAPILCGSHLDSQPTGGRFDGVYGVLAALEAVEVLIRRGVRPRRSIEIVAWSNEEGGRFSPGAMGSQVYAGALGLDRLIDVRDAAGTKLCDALTETLAALPEVPIRDAGGYPAAYLEAHIEQGPRLEGAGVPVGVVTGIQGCLWLEFEVLGTAAHAGTTPHEFRRDAFECATALIQEMRSRCRRRSPDSRFTVGRLTLEPNTPNTIPGRVMFTVDFRDANPESFAELGMELRRSFLGDGDRVRVRELFEHSPLAFPAEMVHAVACAAREQGYPATEFVSGAFHDALFIANVCPAGMVFVRCRGGISHNPAEYAAPEDAAAGAHVLLSALLRLAQEPDVSPTAPATH